MPKPPSAPIAANLSVRRDGTGPPLVLVHGIGSTKGCWEPVLPMLSGYEAIRLDVPGFGDSPPPPPNVPPSPGALAELIAAELERQGVDRAPLVGNSLGGEIVLELARRGLASAVVAFSPSGLSTFWEREFIVRSLTAGHAASRTLVARADALNRSAAFRTLAFAQVHARPWRKTPRQAAEDMRNTARPFYLRCLKAVETRSAVAWLDQVRVPVLIAFGIQDRVLGAHQAPRFVRELPDASLRRLPGAGHIPMSDRPELVASTILEFLGEHN